jgi:hypothetical protein
MLSKVTQLKKKEIDMALYEHPLFSTILSVIEQMEKLSFKEASNIIGGSLIDEFSEIDSSDGDKAENNKDLRQSTIAAMQDKNLKLPYLEPNVSGREYCLVLDLDETLVHFNE